MPIVHVDVRNVHTGGTARIAASALAHFREKGWRPVAELAAPEEAGAPAAETHDPDQPESDQPTPTEES